MSTGASILVCAGEGVDFVADPKGSRLRVYQFEPADEVVECSTGRKVVESPGTSPYFNVEENSRSVGDDWENPGGELIPAVGLLKGAVFLQAWY